MFAGGVDGSDDGSSRASRALAVAGRRVTPIDTVGDCRTAPVKIRLDFQPGFCISRLPSTCHDNARKAFGSLLREHIHLSCDLSTLLSSHKAAWVSQTARPDVLTG